MTQAPMIALRRLSFATAAFAYAVIVIGFIVRITNSGMGCGPDWPLCNGRLIPAFTGPDVVIEYGHRVAVLGLMALALLVTAVAWVASRPGGDGRGARRLALTGLGLLLAQSMLGAVTVWLHLPPASVVLHLAVGLGLLATYLTLGLRAGVLAGVTPPPLEGDREAGGRFAWAAVGLAVAALLFGGLTANLGAAAACQGFPLCSGQLWPSAAESGLPHIHWTHRLLAYALVLHLGAAPLVMRRRGGSSRLQAGAWTTLVLAAFQVVAGAIMVLALLPSEWRVAHAALGTAVWVGVVYVAWLVSARRATATG